MGQLSLGSTQPTSRSANSPADGDEVEAGDLLVVIEAMKMGNPVSATAAGRVEGLRLRVGETVAQGEVLRRIENGDS